MTKRAPNGRTLGRVALMRWRARTHDVERRTMMNQTVDLGHAHLQFMEEHYRIMAVKNQDTAACTITTATELALETLIERSAILATFKELAKTWAEGNPELEQHHKANFNESVDREVKARQTDMLYYRPIHEQAKSEVMSQRNPEHVNEDLLAAVLGLGMSVGQGADKDIQQAYISTNNSISTVGNVRLLLDGAKTVLENTKKYWAKEAKVPQEQINTIVDDMVAKHQKSFAEDEAYIGRQVDYLVGQINYRHGSTPVPTTRKPGP